MNLIPVIFQTDISLPFTGEVRTSLLHFNYAFKYYSRIKLWPENWPAETGINYFKWLL